MSSERFVWPLGIRIIHWGLAICIVLNFFVLEEGDPPHRYLGYIALFFVVVRLFWGVRGRGPVAFKNFNLRRAYLSRFLRGLRDRKTPTFDGHNPLAALTYFSMWFLVFLLAVSGWMMGLDAFWGEEWLENLHAYLSNFLMILVALHLLGIASDAYMHRRKTWLKMLWLERKKKER